MNASFRPSVFALFLAGAVVSASAQLPIPEPAPANPDQPIEVSPTDPLASIDKQLGSGVFAQRGAFAKAFDEANRLIEAKVAALKARGLSFPDEASTNLEAARAKGVQAFRDLSLTTEETWPTARSNALQSVRRIQEALQDLDKSATTGQA